MAQKQQTGKRIVSKGRYAANVGKCLSLAGIGLALEMGGFVGFVITVGSILAMFYTSFLGMYGQVEEQMPLLWLLFACVCGSFSSLLWFQGRRISDKSRNTDTGVPLTRANTANLTATDSLVRASQEPVQLQETVLLRSSVGGQDRQEAHLLRASVDE